ncbi:MAG: UPF0104 family protein [Calditrichia bacterium]
MSFKQALKFKHVLWIIIPFLVWWVLKTAPLPEVWKIVQRLDSIKIAILIGVNLSIVVLFSLRWYIILKAQGNHTSLFRLFLYRLAGFGFSYFTPGLQVGGEPFQIFLLNKREKHDGSMAIASVFLDKLVEIGTKFLFLIIGILAIIHLGLMRQDLEFYAFFLLAALFVSPILAFYLLYIGIHPLSSLLRKLPASLRYKPRLARFFRLMSGSESKMSEFCRQKPLILFWAYLVSTISWFFILFEFWLSLHFLGIHLNLIQLIGALAAARIAFLLPIPAGLGTLEAGLILVMNAFGQIPAAGLAIGLIVRGRDILFGSLGITIGYVLLGNLKIQFKDLGMASAHPVVAPGDGSQN